MKHSAVLVWHELPRSIVAGLVVLVAAVPLGASFAGSAPGWIRAVATVPLALALTGLARFAAAVARGDGPQLRLLVAADPVLALLLAGVGCLAWAGIAAGGAAAVAGTVGAAVLLVVFPYTLTYGALRGRRGLQALRGGAILVAYRPSWALTLVGVEFLGGFAIVASAGVLAVVVLPLLLTVAAAQTIGLLEEIDAHPRW